MISRDRKQLKSGKHISIRNEITETSLGKDYITETSLCKNSETSFLNTCFNFNFELKHLLNRFLDFLMS